MVQMSVKQSPYMTGYSPYGTPAKKPPSPMRSASPAKGTPAHFFSPPPARTRGGSLPEITGRRHSRLHDMLVVYEGKAPASPIRSKSSANVLLGGRQAVRVADRGVRKQRPVPSPELLARPLRQQVRREMDEDDERWDDTARRRKYLPSIAPPGPLFEDQKEQIKPVAFIPVRPPPLISAKLPSLPVKKPVTVEVAIPKREEVTDLQMTFTHKSVDELAHGLYLHSDIATGLRRPPLPEERKPERTLQRTSSVGGGSNGGKSGRLDEAEEFAALWRYARHNRYRELQDLIDTGAHPDLQDEHGNTALHIACQNGYKRICKIVLRCGANINVQNHMGQTALHFCYEYGFDELATYLKGKGADDSVRNMYGLTCYHGLHPDSEPKAAYDSDGGDDFYE